MNLLNPTDKAYLTDYLNDENSKIINVVENYVFYEIAHNRLNKLFDI